jgi:hypothetical protein
MRSKSTLAGLLPSLPGKTLPLSSQSMSSHRHGRSLTSGRAGRRSASRLLASPARPSSTRTIGVHGAATLAKLTRYRVALRNDLPSFSGSDLAAVDVADDIPLPAPPARHDASEQCRGDVADGGVVVFAGSHHEPVMARRKGRIAAPGVISGQENRFSKARIATLGWSAVLPSNSRGIE